MSEKLPDEEMPRFWKAAERIGQRRGKTGKQVLDEISHSLKNAKYSADRCLSPGEIEDAIASAFETDEEVKDDFLGTPQHEHLRNCPLCHYAVYGF